MREFGLIIVAGLGSAFVGGAFGALIGWLSPEFIDLLTRPVVVSAPVQFATAIGLVAGLFIGALAMAFGIIIGTIRTWVKRPAAPTPGNVPTTAEDTRRGSAGMPDDKYYLAR